MSLDVGLTIDWQKDNLNFTLADFISRLFITVDVVVDVDVDVDSKLLLLLLLTLIVSCCCCCLCQCVVAALLLTLTVSCPSQKKFYTVTFLRRAKPEQPTLSRKTYLPFILYCAKDYPPLSLFVI